MATDRDKEIRLSWHNLGGSLWLSGGKESQAGGPLTISTPAGNLRRCDGVHPIRMISAPVRPGSHQVGTGNAHSIYHLFANHFLGESTFLYFNDLSLGTTVQIASGLNGNRLSFAKMPAQIGDPDSIFVSGGGTLLKTDQASPPNVTNWGIEPPNNGMQVKLGTQRQITVLAINNDHTNWTASPGTLTDDTGFHITANSSLKLAVGASGAAIMTRALSADLTQFSGAPIISTPGDIISFYCASSLASQNIQIQIDFDLGTNFASDYYSYTVITNVQEYRPQTTKQQIKGIGGLLAGQDLQVFPRISNPTGIGVPPPPILGGPPNTSPVLGTIPGVGSLLDEATTNAVLEYVNQSKAPSSANAWTNIAIAKSQFTRIGNNDLLGWADISNIRVSIVAAGSFDFWINLLQMTGGAPLQGTYQYYQTLKNSVTGSRSNPNATPVTIANVQRCPVVLTALQQSPNSDPQADTIEIWRTLGNGAYWFLADTVPLGTTTYTDTVGDYFGMTYTPQDRSPSTNYAKGTIITPSAGNAGGYSYWAESDNASSSAATIAFNQTPGSSTTDGSQTWFNIGVLKVLQDVLIQFDNTVPQSNFTIVAGPWQGSLFWVTGVDGRVYYSPPGRPESLESWLDITSGTDPMQTVLIYNNNLYAISREGVFQILAIQSPIDIPGLQPSANLYTFQPVEGAPGTPFPFSAVATDQGIIYCSKNAGFVLFNGQSVARISDAALGLLMYGQNVESYTAFTPVCADFGTYSEYMVSDASSQTFAYNTATGSWRSIGVGMNAISSGAYDQAWTVTLNGEVVHFETSPDVNDSAAAIPYQIEVPSQEPQAGTSFTCKRIYVEANIAIGQDLIPYAVIDGNYIQLPALPGKGVRAKYEINCNQAGSLFGVRIVGSLTAYAEVFFIEMDCA